MDLEATDDIVQNELDIELVKKRSITGVVAITSRGFILQAIAFAATFALTIFLSPQEYGIFFVVSAVVNFLVYFSDIGLAAALIQKKEQLNDDDLSTTFTIQQILVVTLVGIALISSQSVTQFYHFSQEGLWLFRSLVFSLFLSSLKTIPSIKLERSLEFSKLIIPQIAENIAFYSVAVVLAWQGKGVNSFTVAVLARGIVGLFTMYLLSPWWPRIGINKDSAKSLLKFGVPFQLNSFLALIKDDFLTAFLGKVLPLAQVGYLGWAQKWALFPLRMFMDSINKVTFPAYSRLQDHKDALCRAIEKSLFFVTLFISPLIIGMVVTAPLLLQLIPKYQKWEPALLALFLFAISSLWASVSTTITSTFAAIGKIGLNLKLMVMWTSLTWLLTPWLIHVYGYNGVALAGAIVGTSSIVPVILMKKILPVRIGEHVIPNLASAFIMGVITYILIHKLPASPIGIIAVISMSAVIYGGLIYAFQGSKLKQESQSLLRIILRR